MLPGHNPSLAVVGATGAVGRTVCDVMPLRPYVWGDLRLAAGQEDVGSFLRVGLNDLPVRPLTPEFFDGVDIALIDVPEHITPEVVGWATERGVVVVDNSSIFRMDPDVPLVCPEVNARRVHDRPRRIIANPGATVLTMIDVLGVLHSGWQLTELVLTTLQAASGLGRQGMARLYDEIEVVAGNRDLGQRPGDVRRLVEHELGPSVFPGPLAMNVLPMVGHPVGDGWTTEEMRIRDETRKVLDIPDLRVSATCVRVPVVTTHSVSVHATFERPVAVDDVRRALVETPAVVVLDDLGSEEFPTPSDIVGADPRFAGRIRQSPDLPHTVDVFICGDNLRKGSALNMLQTAELVAHELTARG